MARASKPGASVGVQIPMLKVFGPRLRGMWQAFGCANPNCGSVWMVRTKDMNRRLKITHTADGKSWSTMPCPVCFRTGRIE